MIEYQYLPEHKLLVYKVCGEGTFEQLFEITSQLKTQFNFGNEINFLIDNRKQTAVAGDISEFVSTAEIISDEEFADPGVCAFIFDSNNEEFERNVKKYIEGYILMCSASNIEHRIFYEEDWQKALEFVGLDKLPPESIVQY